MTFYVHINHPFLYRFCERNNLDKDASECVYQLVWIVRNLAVRGGTNGRQAVLDATNDNFTRVLLLVGDSIRRFLGDTLAALTQNRAAEIYECYQSIHAGSIASKTVIAQRWVDRLS